MLEQIIDTQSWKASPFRKHV